MCSLRRNYRIQRQHKLDTGECRDSDGGRRKGEKIAELEGGRDGVEREQQQREAVWESEKKHERERNVS